MDRATAAIYLLIKLHAAFFTETPSFHVFFKSVFHYHPASINESVWRYGISLVRMDANIDNVQKLWSENIKDLSSYIDKTYDTTNGKAYKDVVIPSMISLAGSLFDGKTMCIPYIPQAFMIFCNKGLLEECGVTEYPQTWEELMDACEKVKAAGHIPVTTDSNYCTSWVGYYMSRRLGNDRVMELAKDSSQWASEQGVKDTAEAIAYMAAKGYFDPNIESNVYPAAQQDMVISENVAMYINGTWLPNEVAATTPDDFKWGAYTHQRGGRTLRKHGRHRVQHGCSCPCREPACSGRRMIISHLEKCL